MKCPCFKCEKRTVRCHVECFDYILYQKWKEQDRKTLHDYWVANGRETSKRVVNKIRLHYRKGK